MLLFPPPLCPLTAGRLLALKATVLLLLVMLVKARIRIQFFSALGIFLLLLQTLVFLAASGALGLALVGGAAVAMKRGSAGAAAGAGAA